jgi:putative transposase
VPGAGRERFGIPSAPGAAEEDICTRRHLSETALLVEIRAVYAEARGAYGWPRIWRQLRARAFAWASGGCSADAAARHPGRGKRRFRVSTTDSKHALPIAPNLLDRNFTVAAPNQSWAGDMTYIPTEEGWLFLAVVIDLFSRKVVGWSMRRRCSGAGHRALDMAWHSRLPGKEAGSDLP